MQNAKDQKTIWGALTRILFTPANIFVGPSLGGVQFFFIGLTLEVPLSSLGDKNRPIHWKKPPHYFDKTAPSYYAI